MQALEITTFKLSRGLTIADFIAANADVDSWLLKQPGFISRHIAQKSDGEVTDMLIWASAAESKAAAGRLMAELAGSPVHDAIDQSTVAWTVTPVRHHFGR